MNKEPLVSVVVTSYNLLEYIPEAIESLRQQTYKKLQIVVVDDCSTDGTREYLERVAAADPRVLLIQQAVNQGCLKSKLAGISAATGDYFFLCDGDDWVSPRLVETCLNQMTEDTPCVTFGFELVEHDTRRVIPMHLSKGATKALQANQPLSTLGLSSMSHIMPICFYSAAVKPKFLELYESGAEYPYFDDLLSYFMTMSLPGRRIISDVLYHYRINRPGQSIDGWWRQRREVKYVALATAIQQAHRLGLADSAGQRELLFYKLVRIAHAETGGLLKFAPGEYFRLRRTLVPLLGLIGAPSVTTENRVLMAFYFLFRYLPTPVAILFGCPAAIAMAALKRVKRVLQK